MGRLDLSKREILCKKKWENEILAPFQSHLLSIISYKTYEISEWQTSPEVSARIGRSHCAHFIVISLPHLNTLKNPEEVWLYRWWRSINALQAWVEKWTAVKWSTILFEDVFYRGAALDMQLFANLLLLFFSSCNSFFTCNFLQLFLVRLPRALQCL